MCALFQETGAAPTLGGEKGLFGKGSVPPPPPVARDDGAMSRVRVLEERLSNVRAEIKLLEDNLVRRNKLLATELKTLTSELSEFRREMDEIKDRMLLMVRELQSLAKKEDVLVLQKYIEMWEPINFVTHNELKEALREKEFLQQISNQNPEQ